MKKRKDKKRRAACEARTAKLMAGFEDFCATCGTIHSYMSGSCEKCGGHKFRSTPLV